jgi:hypothetical protein
MADSDDTLHYPADKLTLTLTLTLTLVLFAQPENMQVLTYLSHS